MRKSLLVLTTVLFIAEMLVLSAVRQSAASQKQAGLGNPNFDTRAIVVLEYLNSQPNISGIQWPRVAFAIGDGTLLLTAAHCVTDSQLTMDKQISIDPVVISPYYGDVFDFKVIAIDKKADLAILKAPWPKHPALSLASEEEFVSAKKILIASRPQSNTDKSNHPGKEIKTELLPVFKSNGINPASALVLQGTKSVIPGWSGSPMLIPETGKIAGVLGMLQSGEKKMLFGLINLSKINFASGCNVHSVKELINKKNIGQAALAPSPELQDIPDAQHSFDMLLDYFGALWDRKLNVSLQIAEELSQKKPDSAQVHLLLALAATAKATDTNSPESDFFQIAQASYEKALQFDPNNAHIHSVYGDFLKMTGRNEASLIQCNEALALDPNNSMAIANKLSLLKSPEKEAFSEKLLAIEPNNPLYLCYYSDALRNRGEDEKALEAAQKAVAIEPNGLFYGRLADALLKLNRLDEAEPYLKMMTEKCGCQWCWFDYAMFLERNRPNKLDEAEKALTKAESLSGMKRVTKENINIIKLELYEKTSPQKAETLAKELTEISSGNGNYWFGYAGILRKLEKYQEAVEAAQKAFELHPGPDYRPRLANCLAKAGQFEKAQQIYDELLRDYPERNKYWFWYAELLVDYVPERIADAQEAKDKAASNPAKAWAVSDADLQKLQEKIDKLKKTK
jgi:tetratricopeptide (TPR) repeat protein